MIESIQAVNYESYISTNNTYTASTYKKEENSQVFNMEELLKGLGEYTYSEDDIEHVDENLVNDLKKKFNIEEEDIYKLKKNGYDLERLYIEDMSYYTSLANTKSTLDTSSVNVSKANQLNEKVEVIKKQNDNMYLYSLYSNKSVTINSLYESNYKGNFQKSKTSYSKEDIAKILDMNGLGQTEGNKWAAGKLGEYGMDINRHDVVKLQNMKTAVECLDQQEELEKAQEDLRAGRDPGQRTLIKDDRMMYGVEDVVAIKEELGEVTEGDIEDLVANNGEITIGNLRATLFRNTDLALKRNKAPSFTEGQRKTVEDIKDQIHHIRSKLTTEAAQKLSEKMPLESSKLSEVAEALNAIETETIARAAQEAEIPLNEENVEIIRNMISVRQEIIENPEAALELEIASNEEILISEMHQALLKYEQNETPVEQRFGESIKTVEGQIEELLTMQGIDPTQENREAAKALIMNQVEVNAENMSQCLAIMTKLNTFVEEMTPVKAAELIKEGLNPYEASVDTLLGWISEEKVEKLKASIAETIVALEEKGTISSEQKEGLIGLYRIIQAVNRNKEEVVGYLFKNNLPLTLEKLQEATKYMGNKGIIETAIDDSFGEIQELKITDQTARMMLKESHEQINKGIDIIKMLEQMELPITQQNIEKLQKVSALLYPLIKEEFKKEFGKFEGMDTLPKSFLEKLETIKKVDPQVVSYMLKEGITLSVSNIYWTDKILKNPETYKEILKEGGMLRENLPQSFDGFEEDLDRQEEEAFLNKEAALEKGNLLEYRVYKQIEEMAHLQKELSVKDGVYQIPFLIQGEEKMVHLYFNKKKNSIESEESAMTAVMTYNTKNLGTITAYIQFKEDSINYKIQGETGNMTQKLQEDSGFLNDLLGQLGYLVKSSTYSSFEDHQEISHQPSLIKRGESAFEEII